MRAQHRAARGLGSRASFRRALGIELMNVLFGSGMCVNRRSRAQELCNDRNLRRVHERGRVADFRKLDQFRARATLGHFLRDRRRQNVGMEPMQQQNGTADAVVGQP